MENTQSILTEIVANKKLEVASRKAKLSAEAIMCDAPIAKQAFYKALSGPEMQLVAEIKPKSPSAGTLKADFNLTGMLPIYNKYATAISVLTDKKYFSGDLDLLLAVSCHSPRPALCKDFIIDEYQIYEARHVHAQAVLLIVKILKPDQLERLYRTIVNLGMTPVVEVQSGKELETALALDPMVLLINNRNLEDFSIDLQTTINLVPKIPDSVITISASGIETRADIERLLPYCRRFLVGSSLMKSDDLEAKFIELLGLQNDNVN
jgi:indole-3-glycerol phosphate synthase